MIKTPVKNALADISDVMVMDLIRLLFDMPFPRSGFKFNETTPFVRRIHRIIMIDLSVDDDDEGLGDNDDLPLLEEVDGATDKAAKMEVN